MHVGGGQAQSAPARDLFIASGELAGLMRVKDWAATPLGPVEAWPQSLLTSVSICLNCAFPILVWWGPDLVKIYNDAYAPILGSKHPGALGAPGRQVWPEIWDVIGPMLRQVLEDGVATRAEDLRLMLHRHGFAEECYFSFSYSPIRDETGGVAGVFCPVIETTERVLGERRLRVLGQLAERAVDPDDPQRACANAAASIAADAAMDLPVVAFYLLDGRSQSAQFAGGAGIAAGDPGCPGAIHLGGTDDGAERYSAVMRGETVAVDLRSLAVPMPSGPWATPPERALLIPLSSGGAVPLGFMFAGLSPHRPAGELQGVATLVAEQVATAISKSVARGAERRRSEALAEIDRAKTAFFSNISHEFRTPLTLIMAPLEDALNDTAPDALSQTNRRLLEVVQRNSLRLLRLVNTLLDFSRMEAGRVQASYAPTDLASLTTDLAASFRSAIERAGLALRVDCPALPHPVFVDREMWERIVLNLLSNAFKFTFKGGIEVALRAEGDRAVLTVRDSGVGIPRHELPRLFERFHRIEGQRSRSIEGSGIGLALVHDLVRLHGGSITADSEPGQGASFTVALPFGRGHLSPERVIAAPAAPQPALRADPYTQEALLWLSTPAPDAPPATPSPAHAERPLVVLADDNADMRGYAYRLLIDRYEVVAVGDGAAALREVRTRRPDLLLTDVMMPELDGFGLLRAIRADPDLRELPVILLSARAEEGARAEGLEAGADDYLNKPFSAGELLARIGANLAMARLRRQAAEALRTRTAELELLLETVPVGVWVARDTAARDVHGNRMATRMLRLRDDQAHSLSAPEEMRPTHFKVFRGGLELAPDDMPLQRLARGEEIEPHENQVRFSDGETIDLLVHGASIRDAAGRVTGAILATTDITAQKRAEARLRELNETLETQVEQRTAERDRLWQVSEDLLVKADYEGRLLRISPSWTHLLGYDEATLLARPYQAIIHPDDLPMVMAALFEMRDTGRPVRFEDRVLAADGSWRWIAWHLSPDPNGPSLHGVGRDITQAKANADALRQTEAALRQAQKMEAIGQLTGGIAHDFNNLLTGIAGSLELLQTRVAQHRLADVPRLVGAAMSSVTRASALVQRLLAFARRQTLDARPTDVRALIGGIEELVRHSVGPAIEVSIAIADDLWPTLCDANQLESALLNLCINARDAMPDGGRLTIAATNAIVSEAEVGAGEVQPGDYVAIAVSDTGSGMSPEVIAHAFEPFFTTKPLGHGTGLGLSMVYGFALQSGGHVAIASAQGAGTTVRMYLPRLRGVAVHAASALPAPALTADAAPTAVGGGSVLVVEDDAVVRALLLEALTDHGFTASEAEDGLSGLRILESRRSLDLLVTDVGLPGMNGRQLADAARELRPGLKVLLITGYAHHLIDHRDQLPQDMAIMVKPFAMEALVAKAQAMIAAPAASPADRPAKLAAG